jgi:hypothetical protein
MIKLLERLINKNSQVMSLHAERILGIAAKMINSNNFLERVEAKEIVSSIAKGAGLSKVIKVLRMNLESSEEEI